jgi:hypothetical protein
MQRRQESRIPVEILSRYRTGSGCAHTVHVSNLSRTGCLLIQNYAALPVGKVLSLRLDTIGPLEATVRWQNGRRVGVQFAAPLHPSVLEHLGQQFRFAEARGVPRPGASPRSRLRAV